MVQLTSFCCRYDRRKRYKTKDWSVTHNAYIQLWHVTGTPSTSTCGGFTGLRGHILSLPYAEEAIDKHLEEDVYDVATRADTQL